MEEDVEWRTTDTSLATYLIIQGSEVLRFEWEKTFRMECYFVFKETDDLLDDVADYIGGAAQVEPRRFNLTYAQLKKQMFASKPEPNTTAAATAS